MEKESDELRGAPARRPTRAADGHLPVRRLLRRRRRGHGRRSSSTSAALSISQRLRPAAASPPSTAATGPSSRKVMRHTLRGLRRRCPHRRALGLLRRDAVSRRVARLRARAGPAGGRGPRPPHLGAGELHRQRPWREDLAGAVRGDDRLPPLLPHPRDPERPGGPDPAPVDRRPARGRRSARRSSAAGSAACSPSAFRTFPRPWAS